MTTLANLLIGLGVDTKDFDSDIDRVHGKIGGLGDLFKGALGGVGTVAMMGLAAGAAVAGAGVAALGAGLKVSLEEAMEAQEGLAQLGAVLKSTGEFATVMVGGMTDEAIKQVDKLTLTIADKNETILALGKTYAEKRALIEENLGNTLAKISEYTADQLENVSVRHVGKIDDIQKRLLGIESDYEYDKAERAEDNQKSITRMDEDYADKKAKLVRDLERATTDEQKASIQERLDDMKAEFDKKRKRFIEDAEERELDEEHRKDVSINTLKESLEKENNYYELQTKKIGEENEKRIIEAQNRSDNELKIADAKYNEELSKLKKFISDAQAQIEELSTTAIPLSIVRPTRDLVLSLADSLTGVTRYSDDAILSAENLLLTFTTIGKDTFPDALSAVLDMSTALKQDLPSSAKMLGRALQDPIVGITALRKAGVNFSEDQMDMVRSLIKTGDIAGAQNLILKELQLEFGGSAEAAGKTFAGQLDILRNSLLNVAEAAGTTLLPVMTQAFQTISPHILGLAQTLGSFLETDQFKKWLGDVVAWLKDDLPVAIDTAKSWLTDKLIPGLKEAWKWIKEELIPAAAEIWDWLQNNLPAAIGFSSDILGEYGEILGEVCAWMKDKLPPAIATLKEYWENTLQPALETTWNFIKNDLIPALENIYNWFKTTLPEAIGTLKTKWDEDFMGIRTFVETTWKVIQDTFALFKLAFEGDWYGFGEQLRIMAETFMTGVFEALSKRAEDILGLFFGEGGLKNKNWMEIGEAIVNGIGTGMWNAMKGLANTILGIGNAIIEIFKGFFGIKSPSSLFQGLVRMGIGGGMGLGFEGVAADLPLMMKPLTPALATIPATPAARGGGTGGGSFTLEWHDHSMFRLADRYEMERVLGPTIEAKFRELLAKGK